MGFRDGPGHLEAPVTPDSRLRQQILDLTRAPPAPVDVAAYRWEEPLPGFRTVTLEQEPERRVHKALLWGQPGARFPSHRHGGEENVLVLQGAYRDEERRYGPGDVARRRAGSVHSIEVLPGEDCICYMVSYGEIEILETT